MKSDIYVTIIPQVSLVVVIGIQGPPGTGPDNEFLSHCSVSPDGLPLWDGSTWPGGGSVIISDLVVSDSSDGKNYKIVSRNGDLATVELLAGTGSPLLIITMDTQTGILYKITTINGGIATVELANGTQQNNTLTDETTGVQYRVITVNGDLGLEEV